MALIFSPAQIAAIKQAQHDCEAGKAICQKGAACGFDLNAEHAVLCANQARLDEVLRQFVPQSISES